MALHEYQKQTYKKVGIVVAMIVLPIAGFFVGVQYQKQTGTTTTATTQGRSGRFGGLMMRNRTIGTVKTISATSITVTGRFDNTDHTYTVDTSTTYMNGTSAAQASDVKTGDTVMITLDSPGGTKATQITLNPTFQRQGSTQAPADSDNAILQ